MKSVRKRRSSVGYFMQSTDYETSPDAGIRCPYARHARERCMQHGHWIPPASDSVDSAADLLSKVLNLENLYIFVLNLVYVLVLQIQIPVAARVLPRSCHPKFSIFII
jgi:hypothetical protein